MGLTAGMEGRRQTPAAEGSYVSEGQWAQRRGGWCSGLSLSIPGPWLPEASSQQGPRSAERRAGGAFWLRTHWPSFVL